MQKDDSIQFFIVFEKKEAEWNASSSNYDRLISTNRVEDDSQNSCSKSKKNVNDMGLENVTQPINKFILQRLQYPIAKF